MSEPPVHRPQRSCEDCGSQAAFIVDNQSWYCSKCRKYLPAAQVQQPAQAQQPAYQYPGQAQQPVYGAPANQVPTTPAYAQPIQYVQPHQQAVYPGYGQPQQAYAQPPPVYQPALPNMEMARAKIHNSVTHRSRTDTVLSTMWPTILVIVQLLLIAFVFFGVFSFIGEADVDIADPYASNPSNVFIAVIVIGFLLQMIYTVMQCYLVYHLILRMDDHFERDNLFRKGLIEFIDADSMSKNVDTNVERWTMNTIDMNSSIKEGKKGAITWAVLTGIFSFIPVVGVLFLLYVMHFLTDSLIDHDFNQLNFNRQVNGALAKLGKPIVTSGSWTHTPRRSTSLYVILTIVTLGFFLPYWWFVAIKDWNIHFQNQWRSEDEVISIMKD